MLHDLASDIIGYVALKRAAENREGRTETQRRNVKNLLYRRKLLKVLFAPLGVLL